MTIELTREQEQFIEQEISAGHFTDRGQVIGEALALLAGIVDLLRKSAFEVGVSKSSDEIEPESEASAAVSASPFKDAVSVNS